MSPRACRASIDFARLSFEHGSTLYSDDFLRFGSQCLSDSQLGCYPGLDDWQGPEQLRQRLSSLAKLPIGLQTIFASRSANLMKLAAKFLFRRCRRVMITDLTWPAYENILLNEMHRSGCGVHKVAVRSRLLRGEVSAAELLDLLGNEFTGYNCDGLFLPLVDNLGIRLPVSEITHHLRNLAELRFCVVDGAQAFENVPLELEADYCDFMIAGCHKWLCAHTPMGVGFLGRRSSQQSLSEALSRWLHSGAVDDPLIVFSNELVTGGVNPFGETAPILPMLTANAAAVDAIARVHKSAKDTRQAVQAVVLEAGWEVVSPQLVFESQIILIRKRFTSCVKNLRRRLLENSIAATVYDDGLVRLAIPFGDFPEYARRQLHSALVAVV
ncbi:MAG: aminotransferase class V-fold PLP-dependent enzyme [Pirellula sp.]